MSDADRTRVLAALVLLGLASFGALKDHFDPNPPSREFVAWVAR